MLGTQFVLEGPYLAPALEPQHAEHPMVMSNLHETSAPSSEKYCVSKS